MNTLGLLECSQLGGEVRDFGLRIRDRLRLQLVVRLAPAAHRLIGLLILLALAFSFSFLFKQRWLNDSEARLSLLLWLLRVLLFAFSFRLLLPLLLPFSSLASLFQ